MSHVDGRPILAFFGHHKCATRWVGDITRSVCRHLGLRYRKVYSADRFGGDLARFVEDHQVEFLAYTNSDYEFVKQLPEVRGFHVVRDPRDVCVSAYFSHRNSHQTSDWPELVAHRQRLRSLSKSDGLAADMLFNERFFADMESWEYDTPEILQLRMERLTANPCEHFEAIFRHLGLLGEGGSPRRAAPTRWLRRLWCRWSSRRPPFAATSLEKDALSRLLREHDFVRKSGGRARGESDPKSHYRSGVAGDWREHFEDEHVRLFKSKYNRLLLKLGYEADPDWK